MAAEAIPLIKALLDTMGLTAAGSAKGTKYDIPSRYSKKEQKKDMENHIKRMEAEKAIQDDPYDGLSEEEKQKLADEANAAVEGFGGDPDNKDNHNNNAGKAAGAAATATAAKAKANKAPTPPESSYKRREELKLPDDYNELDDFNKTNARHDVAEEGRNRWGRELEVDESSFMGGSKAAKRQGMSDPEAVQISRDRFMEGKANSLDTDKAISELHGQQKAKLRNRTVTQDSKDILEHQKAPEDMRMSNKALEGDQVKKLLGLGVGSIIGGIANALPLAGADAIEEEKEYLTDFLKESQEYINSSDPKDREIGRKMIEDYFKDRGTSIEEILKKYEEDRAKETSEEPDVDWANIKPEAERLINSDDPEDRKKGHELIEKYYLGDKEEPKKEPKKSKGKGLKGTDLY